MKLLKNIILGLLSLILLAIIGLAGYIGFDALFGQSASDFSNITFQAADGTPIHAYLVEPEGDGPHPAIIAIHEWWGLNAEVKELADRLAEEGYVVLLPDTYRGASTATIPRAIYLRLTVDETLADLDVAAAYAYLANLPNVASAHIGIIGFCYGGGVALRHATRNPHIVATVNLYGDMILDPADLGVLNQPGSGPVMGIFAENDVSIPVEEVRAFEDVLNQTNIDHTITIYPDVSHAFVQPAAIDQGGPPENAWSDMLVFLQNNLKGIDE